MAAFRNLKKQMANKKNYSTFQKIIDSLTFPLRALFLGGMFGLSSLREERMRMVAGYSKGSVLDVGCGPENLFIRDFIGEEQGVGIDIFPYQGVKNLVPDMTCLPFKESSFDTVTLIAACSHIPKPKRKDEFSEFARVLKKGGLLLVTEGEPVTQLLIHKWVKFFLGLQGKKDLDSERGMDKDEEYCMPRQELLSYLNISPLKFIERKPFMWGLNNLYIAQKNQ